MDPRSSHSVPYIYSISNNSQHQISKNKNINYNYPKHQKYACQFLYHLSFFLGVSFLIPFLGGRQSPSRFSRFSIIRSKAVLIHALGLSFFWLFAKANTFIIARFLSPGVQVLLISSGVLLMPSSALLISFGVVDLRPCYLIDQALQFA